MSQEGDNNSDRPIRKQQQRSIITRHKLLDAAIEAFSENGFKATSTRDIAERAGVHHPLITYHFKSKDKLWRAAADKLFIDFRRFLKESYADQGEACPKTRMASLIRAYIHYAKRQPAMHKVLIQEAHSPNPRLEWLVATHLKPFFENGFVLIEELQSLGVAPQGNPKLLFNMIRLSSGGLLALGHELLESSGIDIESNDTLDEISEMIVKVFLPGEIASTA